VGPAKKKVKEAWVQARVAPGQLRLRRSTSGLSLDPRKARRTRLSARRTTRVLALKRCAIVTHPRYHPQWPVTGYHLTSWGRLMRAMDESCAQCFQESSRIHERGPRELSKTGPNFAWVPRSIDQERPQLGSIGWVSARPHNFFTGKTFFHSEKLVAPKTFPLACGTLLYFSS